MRDYARNATRVQADSTAARVIKKREKEKEEEEIKIEKKEFTKDHNYRWN